MNRKEFKAMLKQENGQIRLPKWASNASNPEVKTEIKRLRQENKEIRPKYRPKYLKSIPPKYRVKFPDECPAFLLLDGNGFLLGNTAGEIVEGTFNDKGAGLMLSFARPENFNVYFCEPSLASDGSWGAAWHYTGHFIPLTTATLDMLAVAGLTETAYLPFEIK